MKMTPALKIAALALLAGAIAAQGQTLTVKVDAAAGQPQVNFNNGLYNNMAVSGPAQAFGITVLAEDGIPVVTPHTWIGFCVEIDQGISTGSTYTFVKSPLASMFSGNGALKAAQMAWLFDNHAPSADPVDWTYSTGPPRPRWRCSLPSGKWRSTATSA